MHRVGNSIKIVALFGILAVSAEFNWFSGLTGGLMGGSAPPPPPSMAAPQAPVMTPSHIPDLAQPAAPAAKDPSALLDSLKLLQSRWMEQHQQATIPAPAKVQEPVAAEPQIDLLCSPRWQEAKRLLGSVFFDPSVAVMTLTNEDVTAIMSSAMSALPQDLLTNSSECGLARLMTQLLQLVSKFGEPGASPQMVNDALLSTEPMHSPVMTVLLDIPWVDTVNSGWPYFQLLGQIQMRNWQDPARPASPQARDMILQDESMVQFYSTVMTAIEAQDFNLLVQASSLFLEFAGEHAQEMAVEKPLAFVTAIAGVSIGVNDPVQKASLFDQMQSIMVATIHTPSDLVYLLNTSWPVWSLINLSLMAATGRSA